MWAPILKVSLKLLGEFWREALIASLLVALWLSINHGQAVREQFRVAKADWAQERSKAEQSRKEAELQSKQTLETLNANHEAVLEQAKKQAAQNYARYMAAAAAHRSWAGGVRDTPAPSADPYASTGAGTAHGRPADAVAFDPAAAIIGQCAETTVLYNEWRTLCAGNPKLCEVVP